MRKRNRSSLLFMKLAHVTAVAALFGTPLAADARMYSYPAPSGGATTRFDYKWPPSSTYVVNDTDSTTLDRFLYRNDSSDYEITIPINIRRYVGSLGDIDKLLEKELISKTFKIHMPAYDVDSKGEPLFDCDGDGIIDPLKPEVNEVYFNDELVGVLEGNNGEWAFNDKFELDITKLNFPASPGEMGYNTIGIKIDVANRDVFLSSGKMGCQVWGTKIDWASVKFEVTSPVVFVAGMSGNTGSFKNSLYAENLKDSTGLQSKIIGHSLFVPSFSACDPKALPSLIEHAKQMRESIQAFAEEYGTDSVHLIAHSKGGLDSRIFIKRLEKYPLLLQVGDMGGQPVFVELKVGSLVTHSSPHLGTSIADAFVAYIPLLEYVISELCDMTTQVMQQVNKEYTLPKGVTSLVIGADADQNYDWQINDAEAAGNQLGNPAANILYEWLRDIAQVEVDGSVTKVPTLSFQNNDTMVTVTSALGMLADDSRIFLGNIGKNHGTILDKIVQDIVIEAGLAGALNWRLR